VRDFERRPEDGLFGISNALTGVLPIWVMCDPADVGTVVDSGNLATPSIFVFDRYPGGLGFAQKTYELVEEVLTSALELIAHCPCEDGCPSCVGSPLPYATGADLETRGKIPDKEAALCILHDLLQLEPYTPKAPSPGRKALMASLPGGTTGLPESDDTPLQVTNLPSQIEMKIRKRLARFKGE
jgi:DEAD/DEAH box helicase domain-containing protein